MLQWCTCFSGVHVAVVYMFQWCTCFSGVHVAVVYMLQWCTCCSGVHVGVVYMLNKAEMRVFKDTQPDRFFLQNHLI